MCVFLFFFCHSPLHTCRHKLTLTFPTQLLMREVPSGDPLLDRCPNKNPPIVTIGLYIDHDYLERIRSFQNLLSTYNFYL